MSATDQPQTTPFRRAALQHAAARPHGDILLSAPPSHVWLTAAFVAQAAVLLLWLGIATYTRTAEIGGVLTPAGGMVRVLAPQGGVVIELHALEGQTVAAGEPLFRIRSERVDGSGSEALATTSGLLQARRDSLAIEGRQQSLQAAERQRATAARLDALAVVLQHATRQIGLQQQRVTLAEAAVQRYAQLQASGFVAAAQLQEREAELLDQRQRLADLERDHMSDARQHAALTAEQRDQRLQALRDAENAARNMAALEQELAANESQREQLVRAPLSGVLSGITIERGQSASAGQSLVSIIPRHSSLEAELYAPSRAAGFLREGMPVRLRYQAFPYQKFGQYQGRVREVSQAALRPDELGFTGDALRAAGLLYRVRVSLERQSVRANGEPLALRAGMAVNASIPLDRRRLAEWLFAPLRDLAGPT